MQNYPLKDILIICIVHNISPFVHLNNFVHFKQYNALQINILEATQVFYFFSHGNDSIPFGL